MARIKRGLEQTLGSFRNALLPPKCLVCGVFIDPAAAASPQPIQSQPHAVPLARPEPGHPFFVGARRHTAAIMSAYLCRHCCSDYQPVQPPICRVCGLMFKSRQGGNHLCGDCIRQPKHYHRARSAAVATPVLLEVIHQLKYRKKQQLAKPLGLLLLMAYWDYWPAADIDLLLPIPLHIRRFRRRGFNQSYLLFKDWKNTADRLGLSLGRMRIDKTALVRSQPTRPQTGLGRKQRFRNVKKAFAVRKPENIKDKNVLLIDDVYTTGATVNECARVLRQNGAARVEVLTLARAM